MKTGDFKGRLKLGIKSPFEKSLLMRTSVQAAYADKETGAQEPVPCPPQSSGWPEKIRVLGPLALCLGMRHQPQSSSAELMRWLWDCGRAEFSTPRLNAGRHHRPSGYPIATERLGAGQETPAAWL